MKISRHITGIHLWLLLWKATRAVDFHAQRSVEKLGIGPSDFGVLEALLHKGPLPVNAIGKKILLTSGSMTAAVDRLEQRGLVERRPDKSDRRARLVCLTQTGRSLIQRLFREHAEDLDRATAALSSAEKTALADGLRKLGLSAEQLANQLPPTVRAKKAKGATT